MHLLLNVTMFYLFAPFYPLNGLFDPGKKDNVITQNRRKNGNGFLVLVYVCLFSCLSHSNQSPIESTDDPTTVSSQTKKKFKSNSNLQSCYDEGVK